MSTGYRSLGLIRSLSLIRGAGRGHRAARIRRIFTGFGVPLSLAALLFAAAPAQAQNDLIVAAAADMQPVFAVAGPMFEKKTGIHLKMSYASSSVLSQQMQHGAPFDIFFSADFFFAEQAVASNVTETRNPIPYARGVLVLWAPRSFPVHPLSVDVLGRKDVTSIAIANPDRAPYGRAAVAALKQMNFWTRLSPHIVQAESVAQAAQFALSGNAQLAVISQTLAVSPKFRAAGTYALFPSSQYPDIRQCAVIHKDSPHRAEAHKLLDFMLSSQVQSMFPRLGLQTAGK